jgi:hypothetical protein
MIRPTVFLSYCHRDEGWMKRIAGHLGVLGDRLKVWDDQQIRPGEDWFPAIQRAIDQAQVIILVISDAFLNSSFIKKEEVPRFLLLRQTNGLTVIPVIARPCAWQSVEWLAAIQCYPKDGRALSKVRKAQVDEDLAALALKVGELLSQRPAPVLSGQERKSTGFSVEEGDGAERPPYRGIEPFREDDADLFYGRARLTQRLVDTLRERRFLAVLGASGSGKSSLIHAGLIPALRKGALPGSETWTILPFKPGRRPLQELATHLLRYTVPLEDLSGEIERFSTAMASDNGLLAAKVRQTVRSKALLIVDQFEEIFTQASSDSDRRSFFSNLMTASDIASAEVAVIIILRADFYVHLDAYSDLADRVAARQVFVSSMSEDDLLEAITGPAERSGLRLEKGLVDKLLQEMRGNVAALPLLQQALLELWKRREGDTLTLYAYQAIEGVKGAIVGWADSVYKSLSPARQELARRVLVELVQPGKGTEDTRRRLLQRELSLVLNHDPELEDVVEHLIRYRLLTADHSPVTQERLVEIVHEALLYKWPRLRGWIEDSRANRLTHNHLRGRVERWLDLGRDQGVLARGGELTEFERWMQDHSIEASLSEKDYLEESLDARAAEATGNNFFEKIVTHRDTSSNISKVSSSGVDPRGRDLTPLVSLNQTELLLPPRLKKAPEWISRWKREHGVDDPRRKPILEVTRPWDLAETGWSVVFAPDLDPQVRSALGELLEHRHQQATRDHSHYYKECIYQGESTYEFLKNNGAQPGMMADPENFPYYVLLVGDPQSLPYEFQYELDVNYAVGRICFEHIKDYVNYARSVVRAETRSRPQSQQVVFFGTEHKNDPATRQTAHELVHNLAASVIESPMNWEVQEVLGTDARKERLQRLLGGAETPAFLFAACHGVGFDLEDPRQSESQGALVCQDWPGPDDEEGVNNNQWFSAHDVSEATSLLGLVAFLHASYGLGTPERETLDPEALGRPKRIASHALVSRLPQRLLSLPSGGALAVIGHVDRAWVPNFSGSPQGEGFGAFLYGMRRLLKGHTVGWSMEYFNQSAASLAIMEGFLEEGWPHQNELDRELFAKLWALRNDARNLMVFGDPAVRLPGAPEPRERLGSLV